MSGYTKLFNSILASTIWEADMPTRIVWITLLAMKDQHGVVEASIPGLATFARVIPQARAALENLKAADPDSRTQEEEGRRIRDIEGGWYVINHDKYRRLLSVEERREYLRVKQAEYRAKQKLTPVNTVSDKSTMLTHTEAEAEADTKADQPSVVPVDRTRKVISAPSALDVGFQEFWSAYPKKTGKGAALRSWRKIKPDATLRSRIAAAITSQVQSEQWQKAHGQFIPNPSTWLNQGRWDDEPIPPDAPVKTDGTWVMGYRAEDMVRTPEEVAADEEWEKLVLASDEQAFGVIFLKLRGVLAPFKADKAEIRQVITAYFAVLERWPIYAVRAGADRCAATMTRFPRPAEWIDAIPKAKAAGLMPITDDERAIHYDAQARCYDGDPCSCYLCEQAGVSHRLLRYVPDTDDDGRDLRRADGDKVVVLGHWAHGDELARWYAARDHFFSLRAVYGPKSMPWGDR